MAASLRTLHYAYPKRWMEDRLGKIVAFQPKAAPGIAKPQCSFAEQPGGSPRTRVRIVSLEQSQAIVLRVYPWSETSCIANIYTRDFGKLSVLAKGARRPKSPFEAALDLLSICHVVFISKSADALDVLTEAKLLRRYRIGSRDLLRLNCGYYVAELLDRLTDKGDKQPEIFDLAHATLCALDSAQDDPRGLVCRFELGLLRMIGHLPSWRRCAHCGNETQSGQDANAGSDETWVVFGALAGGILCRGCQLGGRQMIRIPKDALGVLERFSDSNWQGIDTNDYTEQHRPIIRGLLGRYLTVMLDRKLQLHAYLEELGR